jgi:hypothetical protein
MHLVVTPILGVKLFPFKKIERKRVTVRVDVRTIIKNVGTF